MTSQQNLFGAADSTLGYLYQCRYALLLLVRKTRANPGAELSIERFDDIAFEERGTPLELIQTKHHQGTPRNLSDSSSDLWKTLRVWSSAILAGTITLPDIALGLVTTAMAPNGSAAGFLRPTDRNEAVALQKLLTVTQNSSSSDNRPAYDAFLALSDVQKRGLISAIQIFDQEPNIVNVLPLMRDELSWAAPRKVDVLLETLEGWWFGLVVRHLVGASQEPIRGIDLENKIADIQETLRRDNLPTTFCFADVPLTPNPKGDPRLFVQQLRVVQCNDSTISTAICDHYKSFKQRAQWIREDLLLIGELEQYEAKLVDEWQRQFNNDAEDLGTTPAEEAEQKAGISLYRRMQERQINVRPQCTEPIIMRGSYHMLADDLLLGWHQRYKDLVLQEEQQ